MIGVAGRDKRVPSALAALFAAAFGLLGLAPAVARALFRSGSASGAGGAVAPSAAAIAAVGILPLAFGISVAAVEARRVPGGILRNLAAALRLPSGAKTALCHLSAGLAAGILSVLPLLWVTAVAQRLLGRFGFEETMQPAMRWLLDGGVTAAQKAAVAVSALLLAPLGEEVLYRALMLGGLGRVWRWGVAEAYAAAFFAALHAHLSFLPALFLLALALGRAWRRFSIVFSFAMHAGFNLGNLALAALFW